MTAKKPDRPSSDPNAAAFKAVAKLIGSDKKPTPSKPAAKKNPAAVALGRLGGIKGGAARARNLTPEQLAEIGRKGATARWGKKTD